jgi:hypothetical protein
MPLATSVLIALLLSWVPLTATAQTKPEELNRNAAAVASGQRGLEAFRNGEWAAAYSLFHEAETLAHSPVFLLYMARARLRQGASAEALDLYTRVSREPLDERAPDSWRSAVEQAQREAAELQARLTREEAQRAEPRQDKAVDAAGAPRASRNAALAAGAIGVVGIAMGAVAGLVAWVKLNNIEERCGSKGCDPADKSELDSAETWARMSDLGFVVGGTGLASSAIFLWVVPAASTAGNAPIRAGVSAHVRF